MYTVLGYTQQDIPDQTKTVEAHRGNIGKKLGLMKKSEWVDLAKKYKII